MRVCVQRKFNFHSSFIGRLWGTQQQERGMQSALLKVDLLLLSQRKNSFFYVKAAVSNSSTSAFYWLFKSSVAGEAIKTNFDSASLCWSTFSLGRKSFYFLDKSWEDKSQSPRPSFVGLFKIYGTASELRGRDCKMGCTVFKYKSLFCCFVTC